MDFQRLKSLLDEQVTWPDYYTFKFIIRTEHRDKLDGILAQHDLSERPSRSGKYISVTSKKIFHNSEDVISVYKEVSCVEGIISL